MKTVILYVLLLLLFATQVLRVDAKITHWNAESSLGSADASFIGESADDYNGFAVSGIGDVNGDGIADFAVGAWNDYVGGGNYGQTYIFLVSRVGGVWIPTYRVRMLHLSVTERATTVARQLVRREM